MFYLHRQNAKILESILTFLNQIQINIIEYIAIDLMHNLMKNIDCALKRSYKSKYQFKNIKFITVIRTL